MERTIIEVAVSAIGGKSRGGQVPFTPTEVSADILACLDAGAAIAHNHLDHYEMTGPAAAARYGEGWKEPLKAHPDAIIYSTLAALDGQYELGQYAHIVDTAITYGARMGVLDTGSVNLTASTGDGQPHSVHSVAYVNSYATLDKVLAEYQRIGLPSSIAIYDPTFLRAALAYEKAGRLVPGSLVKLYFGGTRTYLDGKPGLGIGLPPTMKALEAYLEMMEGSNLAWAAAVLGGDLVANEPFATAVLQRGGHLRVGLEDYAGDRSPTNAQLVREAAALAHKVGRPPASCSQASAILLSGKSGQK